MLHLLLLLLLVPPLFRLAVAFFNPKSLKSAESRSVRAMLEGHFGRPTTDPLVSEIGHKLMEGARLKARFFIIEGPMLNAVTLPDGDILLWRGLLGRVREHPDRLAGVLAHELGHLKREHYIGRIYWLALLQFVFGIFARPFVFFFMRQIVYRILAYGFSRVSEHQADDTAVDLMLQAGFDPNGLASLFDDLARVTEPMGMLGTHPDPRNRADRVRQKIARLGLTSELPSKRKILDFPDAVDRSSNPLKAD